MARPIFGDPASIHAAKKGSLSTSLYAYGIEALVAWEKEQAALYATAKERDEAVIAAMMAARSPQVVTEVTRRKRVRKARVNTIAPSDYSGEFRVIYNSLDTYEANLVGAEVREDFMALLPMAQAEAKEAEGETLSPLPPFLGVNLSIRPHGGGTFAFLLGNADVVCKVRKEGHAANLAAAQVRLSAACLHRLGYVTALRALAEWVQVWCPGARLQPSQVDLAVDTQGWSPTFADFASRSFVCPVGRPTLIPYGDYLGYARFGTGGASGSRSGKAPIQLVMYDKTEDIRVHDKGWMVPLWAQNPAYVDGEMVYRIEARVTREWLHDRGIESQEVLLGYLPAIWYEALEWCRYCVPPAEGEDSNRSRLKTRDEWRLLRGVQWTGGMSSPIGRLDQARPKLERTLAALGGHLTTLNALFSHVLPIDLRGILELAGPALEKRYASRGESFYDRVEKRSLRLGGISMVEVAPLPA